jgi:pyruvate/2-oxoglutarate dehydrogenase complex dihydrolipoamide dehydrogenase (E3) component
MSASTFAAPKVDLAKLLAHKNKVVGKLTGGLAAMAKMRKVTVVRLRRLRRPSPPEGGDDHPTARTRPQDDPLSSNAIIAAGSRR